MRSLQKRAFRPPRTRTAFTLVEVVVSAGILAVFITGSFVTIVRLNRFAMIAKMRTAALALAQQQIDTALTASWQITDAKLPAALVTHDETDLPLNDDPLVKKSANTPFSELDLPLSAKRHTEVADLGPRTKVVTVTVTYTYLGKEYEVELSTIRACDSN